MLEMKDSGIEWIGQIPKHWDKDFIKYHLKRNEQKNHGDKEVLSVYREYGVIPKDSRDDNHNVTSEDTSKYKYVKKGNLVINKMKAWQGSLAVSEYEGIVSPAYFIYEFTSEKYYKKYFHYLIRGCYKDEFRRISGGIREGQWDLSPDEFRKTPILLPPIEEQKKIVEFLDDNINTVNSLYNNIQKQIETLKEYKKSIITKAVTKGLNPDVEMKDSGIEWIGKIPKSWSVTKIKYSTKQIAKGISPNYTELEKTKIINQATFSKGYYDTKKQRYANDDFVISKGKVKKNDILLATTGGGVLGKTYYFQEDGEYLAATDVAYLRVDESYLSSKFLYYCLSVNYDMFNAIMANGSTNQTHLDMQALSNMYVAQPSINEQRAIINTLDDINSKIDGIIQNKNRQLKTLDQYKQSFIFEYVTGKKALPYNES